MNSTSIWFTINKYSFINAFNAERQARGLPEVDLYDDLIYPERVALTKRFPRGEFTRDPSADDLGAFDLSGDDDTTVQLFYALGGDVADFSCLGQGVRPHVHLVFEAGNAEIKKRGIKPKFFCDWVLDLPNREG